MASPVDHYDSSGALSNNSMHPTPGIPRIGHPAQVEMREVRSSHVFLFATAPHFAHLQGLFRY